LPKDRFFYILELTVFLIAREAAMYLQEILEVAVGLVLVWLVVSIATMSFLEWISSFLNLRAKDLKKSITQMLSSKDLTRRFYGYPLISNLFSRPKKTLKKLRLPSYIPADKFGATLFELIVQAGVDSNPVLEMTDEIQKKLVSIESPEQQTLAKEEWDAIQQTASKIAAAGLGVAALDSLKLQLQTFGEKYPELKPTLDILVPQVDNYYGQFVEEQRTEKDSVPDSGLAMRQFRLGLRALEKTNPQLNKSITAIVKKSDGYDPHTDQVVGTTCVNLESWFNDAMDRLSGDYKRNAQLVAFIIGSILALTFNVDTIHVATSLWREPILRQTIIAQVENYTSAAAPVDGMIPAPLESIPVLETQLEALTIPFGWTTVPFDTGGRQCTLLPFQKGKVWGIPSQDDKGQAICKILDNLPIDFYGWLVKILGMLITGAAAAQGAPFWFDLLKKLVNVRSTGINPAEETAVG
jgi:hypothetical protein